MQAISETDKYPAFFWLVPSKKTDHRMLPLWRDWLTDQGSLTKRLVASGKGSFRVSLTKNAVAVPAPDERKVLEMPDRHYALIREVKLLCFNEVWVTARSIIPLTTLTGEEKQLARLGEKPLGGFLFSAKTMHRTPFQFGHRLYSTFEGQRCYQWARRSVFFLHDKPLLVSEFFEPAIIGEKQPQQ